MLTRRRFLIALPAFAAAQHLAAQSSLSPSRLVPRLHKKPPPPPAPMLVYFGTDTSKGVSKGIYQARFDTVSGKLTEPALAAATLRPSYLALSPAGGKQRCLYAVNAVSDASATVSSFIADPISGALKPLNRVSSDGAGPCYISVDPTGRMAFVANYSGSTIATYRIQPDGELSQPVEHLDFKDARFGHRGPNAARQDVPHPHSTMLSPDGRFLLVNDLGSDEISVFTVDPATATLGEPSLFSDSRPGAGPRHIAYHPNGRWIYAINELDSTLDHFLWTTTSSHTAPQGLLVNTGPGVKTTASGYPVAKNTAAEVAISSDGLFLYASNRGEDTLVVFSIAPSDGALTFVERIACGGKTPRHFTLDPTGHWLLCGNQDSATVTVFRRDAATGKLGGPTSSIAIDSPMFTLFA